MEQEDWEDEVALEYSISDDEGNVPVPSDWNNLDFNNLVVNEGNQVSWEYTRNEVCQGDKYSTSEAIKDVVVQWATSLRMPYTVVNSYKKWS